MKTTTLSPFQKGLLYVGFGIGILMMGFGCYWAFMAWQSTSWPEIEGTIEWKDEHRWVYSYSVDGKEYVGRNKGYGHSNPEEENLSELRRLYPKGKTINIYYSPSNPARSVLQRGFGDVWWLPFLAGGFFSTFAGWQIWYWNNRSKQVLGPER